MKYLFTTLCAVVFFLTNAAAQQIAPDAISQTVKDKIKSVQKQSTKPIQVRSHNSKPGHSKFYTYNVDDWEYVEDRSFVYDAVGNLIEYTTGDSVGNFYDKATNTYTSEGWLKSNLMQTWNSGAWENVEKTDYIYNQDGLATYMATFTWNGSGWDTTQKTIYLFDVQGWDSLYLFGTYSGTTWNIDEGYKFVNTYDANNNIQTQETQEYNSGAWDPMYRDTYTWNVNNEVTEVVDEEWNGAAWENSYRVYNMTWHDFEASQLSSLIYQEWDGSAWEDFFQSNITYDANGGYVETDQLYMGAWVNYAKITHAVDAHLNTTMDKFEIWETTGWELAQQDNYNHTYNGDDLTQTIIQLWDDGTMAPENYSREDFSEFQFFSGLVEIESDAAFGLFPNPAHTTATVSYTLQHAGDVTVTVCDQLGRIRYIGTNSREAGTHQVVLSVDQLASGIYFVNVITEKGTDTATLSIGR
jgi:hypothetical protein